VVRQDTAGPSGLRRSRYNTKQNKYHDTPLIQYMQLYMPFIHHTQILQISDFALSQTLCSLIPSSPASSPSPSTSIPSSFSLGIGCIMIFAYVPAECALDRYAGLTTNVLSTIYPDSISFPSFYLLGPLPFVTIHSPLRNA
jgi:hypothetical protein